MMAFAEKVSTDAASMTDADSLRLREVGFSDREIAEESPSPPPRATSTRGRSRRSRCRSTRRPT